MAGVRCTQYSVSNTDHREKKKSDKQEKLQPKQNALPVVPHKD